VDREFSNELTGLMPIVSHRIGGVDCGGCIVAVVESGTVELRCNKCGTVVGVVQVGIMEGLLGLDCADATCPHCGRLNTFSRIDEMLSYVCHYCGAAVDAADGEDEKPDSE
jgi:phage FluMu protein Com